MSAFASLLPFLCALVALLRAPIVVLPLLPSCLLIAARAGGIVDISSASHPLRILVPLASMVLAFGVAWACVARRSLHEWQLRLVIEPAMVSLKTLVLAPRALACAVLLFASAAVDVIALPLWRIPGTWALVPVQIGVCVLVLGALLAPERWLRGLRLHRT